MHKEMIKHGIDPNNPEFIPICRQKAIIEPKLLWWTQ